MNWTFTPEPIYSNPLQRALVLMMLLAGLVARAAEPATNRLNILFLLADDWAWPHASCLGCPCIKTPTFDRLA